LSLATLVQIGSQYGRHIGQGRDVIDWGGILQFSSRQQQMMIAVGLARVRVIGI